MQQNPPSIIECTTECGGDSMSVSKAGFREDLGHFVRSSWEANYARYLKLVGIPYQYEPITFYFEGVKNGAVNYKPDFYLPSEGVYKEIKGRETSKDRTKWKRMKKFYPDIKVEVVGKTEYKVIEDRYSALIPEWEFPDKKPRNAHKEKVDSAIQELEAQGYKIAIMKDNDMFDFMAYGEGKVRFIKIEYLVKGDALAYEEILDEMVALDMSEVYMELWIYRYGKKGYERHTI